VDASPEALVRAEVATDLGLFHSPLQPRTHLIDIGGWIVGGELHMAWTYSRNVHHAESIEKLAATFIATLTQLIEHCLSPGAGSYTPSDFALAGLDQGELDDVLSELQDL
jgi:non-ribosomal peptide synthase protein (TIGR01720 family)